MNHQFELLRNCTIFAVAAALTISRELLTGSCTYCHMTSGKLDLLVCFVRYVNELEQDKD